MFKKFYLSRSRVRIKKKKTPVFHVINNTYDLLQIFVSLIVIKREQFQVRVKYNNNIISSFAFT